MLRYSIAGMLLVAICCYGYAQDQDDNRRRNRIRKSETRVESVEKELIQDRVRDEPIRDRIPAPARTTRSRTVRGTASLPRAVQDAPARVRNTQRVIGIPGPSEDGPGPGVTGLARPAAPVAPGFPSQARNFSFPIPGVATTNGFFAPSKDARFNSRTRRHVDAISKAGSKKEESKLIDELKTDLEDHFEARMDQRESQIEELQKRIEKLKSQLRERREAKDEIVELKLKTLVNEAKGLGF